MKPFGAQSGASDSSDNPEPANGQRKLMGPNPDVKARAKVPNTPYNNPSGGEGADAAAGGASYFANVGACLNNVNHP